VQLIESFKAKQRVELLEHYAWRLDHQRHCNRTHVNDPPWNSWGFNPPTLARPASSRISSEMLCRPFEQAFCETRGGYWTNAHRTCSLHKRGLISQMYGPHQLLSGLRPLHDLYATCSLCHSQSTSWEAQTDKCSRPAARF